MLSLDRSLFPATRLVTYLDTAAEGLPPLTARDAVCQYLEAKMTGSPGRVALYETERETVQLAAQLLGAPAECVTFLAHASAALNLLANSLDWQAGDEVVLTDLEFPSNVVVWLRLRDLGVQVRVVASENGIVSLDRIAAALTPRTRVVSVSHVSYKTGTRIDYLEELADLVHRQGALFCVDATQSLGRLPVPLKGVDFLVGSSYKWLLGIHGLGVVYVSPDFMERLRPATAGWYSIQEIFTPDRFERFLHKNGAGGLQPGMPNFGALYALRASLRLLLELGVPNIERELAGPVERLRQGLERLGFGLLTPTPATMSSGIVSFQAAEAEQMADALRREGIIVWGGDDRVRASLHIYNTQSDVDNLLSVLATMPVAEPKPLRT